MKSVMLSVQPQWCELIASGKKTIEVRKSAPKEAPFKGYIYQTKKHIALKKFKEDYSKNIIYNAKLLRARGKIIGEFICDKVEKFTVGSFRSDEIEKLACLTYEKLIKYFYKSYELDGNTVKFGYAWHISELKIYDKPKELRDFKHWKKYDWWDYGHHTNKPDWELQSLTRPPQSWCYVEELQ